MLGLSVFQLAGRPLGKESNTQLIKKIANGGKCEWEDAPHPSPGPADSQQKKFVGCERLSLRRKRGVDECKKLGFNVARQFIVSETFDESCEIDPFHNRPPVIRQMSAVLNECA